MPPVGQQAIATRKIKKSSAGSEVSSSDTRKIETIVTSETEQAESKPNINVTYVITEPKETGVKTKKSKKSKSSKLVGGKIIKTQSTSSIATEDGDSSVKIVELAPEEEIFVKTSASDIRSDSGIFESNTETTSESVSKDVNKKTEKVKMIGGKIKKFFSGDKSDSSESVNKVDENNKMETLKTVSDIVSSDQSIVKSESRSSFKEMKASSMSSKKTTGTKVIKTSTTTIIGPDGKEVTTVTVSDPEVSQSVFSTEKNSLVTAEGEVVQSTEGGKTDYKMKSAVSAYSDNMSFQDGHSKADMTAAFITNESKSTAAGIKSKSQLTEIKGKSTSDGIESTEITRSSTSNISDNTVHDSFGSHAVDSVKMIGGKLVKMFGKSGDSKSKNKKKSQINDNKDFETTKQTESSENVKRAQSKTITSSSDQNISDVTTKISQTSSSSSREEKFDGTQQSYIVGGSSFGDNVGILNSKDTSDLKEIGVKLIKEKPVMPEDRWNIKTNVTDDSGTSVITTGEQSSSFESIERKSSERSKANFESKSSFQASSSSNITSSIVKGGEQIQEGSTVQYLDNQNEVNKPGLLEPKQMTRLVGGKLVKSKEDILDGRWNKITGVTKDSDISVVSGGENIISGTEESGTKSSSNFESSSFQTSTTSKIISDTSIKTDRYQQDISLSLSSDGKNLDLNKLDSVERKQNTRIVGGKLIKSKDDTPTEKQRKLTKLPHASGMSDLSDAEKSKLFESSHSEEIGTESTSNLVSTSASTTSSQKIRETNGLVKDASSIHLDNDNFEVKSTSLDEKQSTRIVGGKLIKSKDDIPTYRWNKTTTTGDSISTNVSDTKKSSSTFESTTSMSSSSKNISGTVDVPITTRTSNLSTIQLSGDVQNSDLKFESDETSKISRKSDRTFGLSSSSDTVTDNKKSKDVKSHVDSAQNDIHTFNQKDDVNQKDLQSKLLGTSEINLKQTGEVTSNANNIETVETVKMVGGKIIKVLGTRQITDTAVVSASDYDVNSQNIITSSSTSQQTATSTSNTSKTFNKKSGTIENPYVKYDERPVKPAKKLDEILASESIYSSNEIEGQTVKMVGGKLIKHGKMKSPTRKLNRTENVQDILSDNVNSTLIKSDFDSTKSKHMTSVSETEMISRSSSFKTEKTFVKESSVQETILTSDGKVISTSNRTSRDGPNAPKNIRMIGGKLVKSDDTQFQTLSSEQSISNEQYAQDISNLQSHMIEITDKLNDSPTTKRSPTSRSSKSPDKKPVRISPDRVTHSSEKTLRSRSDFTSNVEETNLSTDMMSTYHEPVCTCPPEDHFVPSEFTDHIMSRTFTLDEHNLFERGDKTSIGVSNIRDETDLTRKIISSTNIFDESNVSKIYDEKTTMKSVRDDRIFSDQDIINRTLVRQDTFEKSDDRKNVHDLAKYSDVRTSKDTKSSTRDSVSENTYVTSTTTNVRMIGGKIVKENVTVTRQASPSPQRKSPTKKTDRSPTPTRRSGKSPVKSIERSPSKERAQPRSGKSPEKTVALLDQSPKPDKTTERGIRMIGGKIIKSEQYATSDHTSDTFSEKHVMQENVTIQSNVNIVHSSSSQDIKVVNVTDVQNITNEKITKDDQRKITTQQHKEKIAIDENVKETSTIIDKKSTEKTSKRTKDRKDKKTETVIKEQCICEICTCG